MYENILVGVGFDSDRDVSKAIDVAAKLLGPGGKITLIHVMEEIPSYAASYIPEGLHEKNRREIQERLAVMAAPVKGAGVAVVDGHSARTMLDWAEDHGVDCIVVASHKPGMADYLLGGTAAHVVRHARCAVHVVR